MTGARRGLRATSIALTSVTAVLVLVFTASPAAKGDLAILEMLDGQVWITHHGHVQLAHDGDDLTQGDVVHAGPLGRAAVTYFDDSVSTLDFNTFITLTNLSQLRNPSCPPAS